MANANLESVVHDLKPSTADLFNQINMASPEFKSLFGGKKGSSGATGSVQLSEVAFYDDKKVESLPPPTLKPGDNTKGVDNAKPGPVELWHPSPLAKSQGAFLEYSKTGKFTPEIKKAFEDAIAETDKGPSPKLPALEAQVKALNAEMEKAFPVAAQKEVATLTASANLKIKNATPEQKKELKELAEQAFKAPPEDQKRCGSAIQLALSKIAPDEYGKIMKLMAPAIALAPKAEVLENKIMEATYEGLFTRMNYANVLWHEGKKPEARQQMENAIAKFPDTLELPDVVEIAKTVGLDVNALKAKYKK